MTLQKYYYNEIKIPQNISITRKKDLLFFSGPLGQTVINLKKIDPQGSAALLINNELSKLKIVTNSKSYYGLLNRLILNKIQGLNRGFLVYLKIVGIGYRASLQENTLFLKLGYSHDILYKIPSSIKVFLLDPTIICLFGINITVSPAAGFPSFKHRIESPLCFCIAAAITCGIIIGGS